MRLSAGQKFTEQLEKQEFKNLKPYALKVKERKKSLGEHFRKYKPAYLEFRTQYQRDRDRIVWAKSFKRLQNKTQIFPYYAEDHYTRRLTHSLEVAQIATTIARALKLNEDATEAIALSHDIGHTPFGHAGEAALNKILIDKGKKLQRRKKRKKRKKVVIGLRFQYSGLIIAFMASKSYLALNRSTNLIMTV